MARTNQTRQQADSTDADDKPLAIVEDAELRARQADTSAEADESEDDAADGDSRVADGADTDTQTDTDDEVERTRKRTERHAKLQRRKEAKDRTFRELNFLRTRNEQLERRFSDLEARTATTDVSAIDGKLSEVERQLDVATTIMAKAAKSDKPESETDYKDAVRIRDDLLEAKRMLTYTKAQQQQVQRTPKVSAPDAEVVDLARDWAAQNTWYRHGGNDKDSQIAQRISVVLDAEGYDPHSDEYWQELQARVEKHPQLKHNFEHSERRDREDDETDADDEAERVSGNSRSNGAKPRRGGPQFAVGGRERPLKRGEAYISPERRAALEELGVWDDPKLRDKYVRRYREYDLAAAAAQRS